MKRVYFLFIFLFFIFSQRICAFSWYTDYKASRAYQEKDYKKVQELLEKEQVDNPNDAQLNYNLGTVYYKLNQFEKAKANFDRAVKNCAARQKELKEFSYFNLGNSLYKNCLQILPSDWEEKEIDGGKLDVALNELQNAVEKYKTVLGINKNCNKAKVNLKKTEGLLGKLKKKKQQQQQQDKQKEEQKQSAEKDDKDKKDQQQQQKGKNGAQQPEDNGESGENNKLEDKQAEQKNDSVSQENTHEQHFQKGEEQKMAQSEKNGTKEEQEKQEGVAFEQSEREEGVKEKGFRVILDDLQTDESKMQKILIKQKSKGQKHLDSKQKPW